MIMTMLMTMLIRAEPSPALETPCVVHLFGPFLVPVFGPFLVPHQVMKLKNDFEKNTQIRIPIDEAFDAFSHDGGAGTAHPLFINFIIIVKCTGWPLRAWRHGAWRAFAPTGSSRQDATSWQVPRGIRYTVTP